MKVAVKGKNSLFQKVITVFLCPAFFSGTISQVATPIPTLFTHQTLRPPALRNSNLRDSDVEISSRLAEDAISNQSAETANYENALYSLFKKAIAAFHPADIDLLSLLKLSLQALPDEDISPELKATTEQLLRLAINKLQAKGNLWDFANTFLERALERIFADIKKADIHFHIMTGQPRVVLQLFWKYPEARRRLLMFLLKSIPDEKEGVKRPPAFSLKELQKKLRGLLKDYPDKGEAISEMEKAEIDKLFHNLIGGPAEKNINIAEKILERMNQVYYDREELEREFSQLFKSPEDYKRTIERLRGYMRFTRPANRSSYGSEWGPWSQGGDMVSCLYNGPDGSLDEEARTILYREILMDKLLNDGIVYVEASKTLKFGTPERDANRKMQIRTTLEALARAEEASGGMLTTKLILGWPRQPHKIIGKETLEKVEQDERPLDEAEKALTKELEPEERGNFKEFWKRIKESYTTEEAKKIILMSFYTRRVLCEQLEEVLRYIAELADKKPEYKNKAAGISVMTAAREPNLYSYWVFEPMLKLAREKGLHVTVHEGETWQPGRIKVALEHIRGFVETGTVERFGHVTALGVNPDNMPGYSAEERNEIRQTQQEIMELLREKNIAVETTPSSNLAISPEGVESMSQHPIRRFYQEIPDLITINDDVVGDLANGVSNEFAKAWLSHPDFTYGDSLHIIKNGFKSAFYASTQERDRLLQHFKESVAKDYAAVSAVADEEVVTGVEPSPLRIRANLDTVKSLDSVIGFLARRDKLPRKADLIMVLGSDDMRVPVEAARLFKKVRAKKILVSGCCWSQIKGVVPREAREAYIYRDILIKEGVPKEAIIIEDESTSTEENIINSKELLERKKILHNRVILMQSPIGQQLAGETFKEHFGKDAYNHAPYIPETDNMSDYDLLEICKGVYIALSRLPALPDDVLNAKSQLRNGIIDLMAKLTVSEGEDGWWAKARAMIWIKLTEQGDYYRDRLATSEDIRRATAILESGRDFTVTVNQESLDINETSEASTKSFPTKVESTEDLVRLNEDIIVLLDIFSRMVYAHEYPEVCHTTAWLTARYISQKTRWPLYHNIATLFEKDIGVSCLPLDVNGDITHLVTAVKYYDKILLIDNISNWNAVDVKRNAYIAMTKDQILKGETVSFGVGKLEYPSLFSLRKNTDEETIQHKYDVLVKLTEGEGLTKGHYRKDEWLFDSLIEWFESTPEKTAGDIVKYIMTIDDREVTTHHRLSVTQDLTKDGRLVIARNRRNAEKWFLNDISVNDFLKKLPEDNLLRLILIVHRILIELSYEEGHREQIEKLREYIDSKRLNYSAKDFLKYTNQKRKSAIEYDEEFYERKIGDAIDDRMKDDVDDAYLVNILNVYSWIAFDRLKWAIFGEDKDAQDNLTRFLKLKHRINIWLNGRDSGFYGISLKASENISNNIERVHEQARYLFGHYNIMESDEDSEDTNLVHGHLHFAFEHMPEDPFTYREYCEDTKVLLSTARRDFDVLEELGLVTIHRGSGRKPNEITCAVPEDLKPAISSILAAYRDKRDIPRIAERIRVARNERMRFYQAARRREKEINTQSSKAADLDKRKDPHQTVSPTDFVKKHKKLKGRLQKEHSLWQAQGILLRNKKTKTGLLLLAEPRAGKSNIARHILNNKDWELIANDFLEWTHDGEYLYAGFRLGKKPSVFWCRDKDGRKIIKPEHPDKREWVRVSRVCLFTKDQTDITDIGSVRKLYSGDLNEFNKDASTSRWRGVSSGLSDDELSDISAVIVSPEVLSEEWFGKTAKQIIGSFPSHQQTPDNERKIKALNEIYEQIEFRRAAAFLFRNKNKARLIMCGSDIERQLLWEEFFNEDVQNLKGWLQHISGLDFNGWELCKTSRDPYVIFSGDRGYATSYKDKNLEVELFVFVGAQYISDEYMIGREILGKQHPSYRIISLTQDREETQLEQLRRRIFSDSTCLDPSNATVPFINPNEGSLQPVTITNRLGLHVRVASIIKGLAKNSKSRVTITKGRRKADASSLEQLAKLAAEEGDTVVIEAKGEDAMDVATKIEEALKDESILGNIGSGIKSSSAGDERINSLIADLCGGDKAWKARDPIIEIIQTTGNLEIAERILKLLDPLMISSSRSTRVAIDILGRAKYYPAIPTLLNILNDKSKNYILRAEAAEALGNIRSNKNRIIETLIKIAKDKNEDDHLRGKSALALAKIGDESLLGFFLTGLDIRKWFFDDAILRYLNELIQHRCLIDVFENMYLRPLYSEYQDCSDGVDLVPIIRKLLILYDNCLGLRQLIKKNLPFFHKVASSQVVEYTDWTMTDLDNDVSLFLASMKGAECQWFISIWETGGSTDLTHPETCTMEDTQDAISSAIVHNSVKGTIVKPLFDKSGYLRIDTLVECDDPIAVITNFILFLVSSNGVNLDKELILFDSIKDMFARQGIVLPDKLTIGGFVEAVKTAKSKTAIQRKPARRPTRRRKAKTTPSKQILTKTHARYPVTITNRLGLHVRVASIIEGLAKNSKSKATITKGRKKADASSLEQLAKLAAEEGDTVVIEAKGEDAMDVATKIEEALKDESILGNIGSGTKSSSAGEDFNIVTITSELEKSNVTFTRTDASMLDMSMLTQTMDAYQKEIGKLKVLKAESVEKAVFAAEPLKRAEASLGIMTLSKDIAAESANIKDITGTIIINDAEIPANQKTLLTLLDENNDYLKALEEKLGCKVRLLSQFNPDNDTSANMIAISKAKIDSIANLRYINLKAVTEDMYLPMEQVIVFAKGLLVYGIDKSATTETAISSIYRLLAKRPIQKRLFEDFLKPNGVFILSLPAPIPVDEKYYQDLHKQAVAALIAA